MPINNVVCPKRWTFFVLWVLSLLFAPIAFGSLVGFNGAMMGGMGFDGELLVIGGATVAYTFPSQWEVGVEFEMTGSVPTLGADVNYYVKKHLFIGIQGGADFDHGTTEYIGPQAGYDFSIGLGPKVFLGPEVQYLYTIHDRGGIFEVLANLKAYF